ncbi:MAG: carbohydrate kinase family protein [Planctomycetota bacterium]
MDIVGIGVSVWDRVVTLDEFPAEGNVVRAKSAMSGLGGGVAVATATAAMLGCSAALVDSLGTDEAGERIVRRLTSVGVDVSAIERHDHLTSSTASIWSSLESSERTIAYVAGTACEQLSWSPSVGDALRQAAIIHTNGRHKPIWRRAIDIAEDNAIKLSFDGGAHRFRDEIVPLLMASDIVIVARQFAETFLDCYQPSGPSAQSCGQLVRRIRGLLKAEILGVTDGAKGSFFIGSDDSVHHQPAIKVERAVETTGCGDTFHGGFLAGHVRGLSLEDSAALASEVASRNARSVGALALEKSSIEDLVVTTDEPE